MANTFVGQLSSCRRALRQRLTNRLSVFSLAARWTLQFRQKNNTWLLCEVATTTQVAHILCERTLHLHTAESSVGVSRGGGPLLHAWDVCGLRERPGIHFGLYQFVSCFEGRANRTGLCALINVSLNLATPPVEESQYGAQRHARRPARCVEHRRLEKYMSGALT